MYQNMTREQIMLLSYVNHYSDYMKLYFVKNNVLAVKDKDGRTVNLTVNLWGDVFDDDTNEKIAVSNLSHADLPEDEQATKWKNVKGEDDGCGEDCKQLKF